MDWIIVDERRPPVDAFILISKYDKRKNPKMSFISIGFMSKKYKWFDHNNEKINEENGTITHWMPLPYRF